jgi:hypothetical protein
VAQEAVAIVADTDEQDVPVKGVQATERGDRAHLAWQIGVEDGDGCALGTQGGVGWPDAGLGGIGDPRCEGGRDHSPGQPDGSTKAVHHSGGAPGNGTEAR